MPRRDSAPLRPRLEAVLSLVPVGEPLADIGTDHAALPIALVRRGLVPRAIAADVAEVPCALARRHIDEAQLSDAIETRRSDGWRAFSRGEVSASTLCGMGGRLVASLVARDRPETLGVRWLVVQANKNVPAMRTSLAALGWRPDRETWVQDELPFVVTRWRWAPELDAPNAQELLLGDIEAAPATFAEAWLTHELRWRQERLDGLAQVGRRDEPLEETVQALMHARRDAQARNTDRPAKS